MATCSFCRESIPPGVPLIRVEGDLKLGPTAACESCVGSVEAVEVACAGCGRGIVAAIWSVVAPCCSEECQRRAQEQGSLAQGPRHDEARGPAPNSTCSLRSASSNST